MRVLVTGATGFVGGCLARRMVEEGHEVHVFLRAESDRWRIADLAGDLAAHEVELRDAAGVERAVAEIRPDCVLHLATYGGFASQKEVGAIYGANLLGTVNLLHACQKTGFDLFVNTGSSSEYGFKSEPMREGDLLEPVGDYGVSKAAATLFCRSEGVQKGLPVVTLRVFSPYGPWDDPRRFVPFAMASLLCGVAPQLASPSSVRDFIYIDDVVEAYLALLAAPAVPGAIYNVGSGRETSLGAALAAISAAVGNGVAPLWGARENQRPEPRRWVADVSALEAHCGWKPATELRDGMQKTVEWMGAHLARYKNEGGR